MPKYTLKPLKQTDREWIKDFMSEHWGSEYVVSRGNVYQAADLPGLAAYAEEKPLGVITYNILEEACEIVTLDSLIENIGIATALIDEVKAIAVKNGCARLWLITTNDNVHAIRFYQKRGFTISAIYPGAIEHSRRLKPQIPLIGMHGIPIRDEIEFEIRLSKK